MKDHTTAKNVQRLLVIMTIPLTLLLMACPPAVDTTVATAVSDEIAPTITIDSPIEGDAYSGKMTFIGQVTDDATTEGDTAGTLASISYSVANNVLLKGTITLDSSGTVTEGADTISWDNSTKTFTFDLSTITLSSSITVYIVATDVKGNSTTKSITLTESDGPEVEISSPDSKLFTKGTIIALVGTVCNTKNDTASASNIKTLTWQISTMGWSGTLTIGGQTSTVTAANSGFTASRTYNFTYEPTTRTFSTQFYIPSGATALLPLEVSATDYNGHTSTTTMNLYENSAGPQLELTIPTNDYYNPNSSTAFGTLTVKGAITDPSTVTYMTWQLEDASYTTKYYTGTTYIYGSSAASPITFTDQAFSFTLDYEDGAFTNATYSNVWTIGDPVMVLVTAANAKSESEDYITLYPDGTGPVISDISAVSNNARTAYAKEGNEITLKFTVTDSKSGLGSSSYVPSVTFYPLVSSFKTTPTPLFVSPMGDNTNATTKITYYSPGKYTTTYTVPAGSAGDGTLPFTIAAVDIVGNAATPATAVSTGNTAVVVDNSKPTGYSVAFSQSYVNNTNKAVIGFSFSGAEAGTTYDYTITDSGTGSKTGTGTITSPTQAITNIDLSGFADGDVDLSVTLTDYAGNVGTEATATIVKDTEAPTGYSADIIESEYYTGATTMSFYIKNGEAGTIYSYAVATTGSSGTSGSVTSLNGGGTSSYTISGTAGHPGDTVASTTVSGVSIGTLYDGTISLSVTLTDAAGNQGTTTAASATKIKDTTPPSGYSVAINEASFNSTSHTLSFVISGAEVGASYSYTVKTSGTSTSSPSAGSAAALSAVTGTVTNASFSITGIDISSLYDGTIKVYLTLTDTYTNAGSEVSSAGKTKDATPPSGYAVAFNQSSYYNSTTQSSATLNVTDAEVGATYNYTITTTGTSTSSPSAGSATSITGSNTITAASQSITVSSLSSLYDGDLSVSFYLTDTNTNPGTPCGASNAPCKDTIKPTAPSASITDDFLWSGDTLMAFTISGAEEGTTYYYTVKTTGTSGTTGSATSLATVHDTVSGTAGHPGGTASDFSISSVNVSTLYDGNISVEVYLMDAAGNTSNTGTSGTKVKDTVGPSAPTVTFDDEFTEYTAAKYLLDFTVTDYETGGGYSYTVKTTGTSTSSPSAGSATALTAVTGTTPASGFTFDDINVSTLYDGTVTVEVTLTDAYGNTGTKGTSGTKTKDATPPSYTVAFSGQNSTFNAFNNNANLPSSASIAPSLTASETSATYSWTITTTGESSGGTGDAGTTSSITGSGSLETGTTPSISLSTLGTLFDGTLTISLTITDQYGNAPSSAVTNSATIKDMVVPTMSSVAATSASSGTTSYHTVIYNEPIYSSSKGALSATGLQKAEWTSGSTYTSSSTALASSPALGATTVYYSATWANAGATPTNSDNVTVTAVASTVYDKAGNVVSSSNTTTGHSISVSGIMKTATKSASSTARSVGTFIQSVFGGTASNTQKAVTTLVTAKGTAGTPSATTSPRSQFHTTLQGGAAAGTVGASTASVSDAASGAADSGTQEPATAADTAIAASTGTAPSGTADTEATVGQTALDAGSAPADSTVGTLVVGQPQKEKAPNRWWDLLYVLGGMVAATAVVFIVARSRKRAR